MLNLPFAGASGAHSWSLPLHLVKELIVENRARPEICTPEPRKCVREGQQIRQRSFRQNSESARNSQSPPRRFLARVTLIQQHNADDTVNGEFDCRSFARIKARMHFAQRWRRSVVDRKPGGRRIHPFPHSVRRARIAQLNYNRRGDPYLGIQSRQHISVSEQDQIVQGTRVCYDLQSPEACSLSLRSNSPSRWKSSIV